MAMGKRRATRQAAIWIATSDLPTSAGHPFYRRLNALLMQAGFDAFVEARCAGFYAATMGRPSLAPARYFRLLLIGYFEGIDSERGIAWRAADSLALREFLGLGLDLAPPDHSTISRTRRLVDLETHQAVFTWILQRVAEAGLLKGKTLGVDATTLEANAALRSIVRRDTGATYEEFLTTLAQASGVATPTRADLAKLDRKRKKKGSNDDWTHPHDPDARITKMKDGRTHLAHKAEHAVDLDTGAVVAVTIQPADRGDTDSGVNTVLTALDELDVVQPDGNDDREIVGDKGYHSTERVSDWEGIGLRTYISEPKRGRRRWHGQTALRDAVYRNRRRIRGTRGQQLLRRRGEYVERPNAHLYETGALRRTHLRGHTNILKRVLIHTGGFNLGLLAAFGKAPAQRRMRGDLLTSPGRPFFLSSHCAGGNRAAAMWFIKWTIVDKWDTDRAMKEATDLGFSSAVLKTFALDYVQAQITSRGGRYANASHGELGSCLCCRSLAEPRSGSRNTRGLPAR